MLVGKLLSQLVIGRSRLDTHPLSLVGAGHNTPIVIREHYDRLPIQIGTEHTLARDITVITIDNPVHRLYDFQL